MTIFDDKLRTKTDGAVRKKERVVVLDGPLSSIYTKALLEEYPNPAKLVQETQAMDVVTIAAIQKYDDEARLKELARDKELSYVYTTSVSRLNNHDAVSSAIDKIETARQTGLFSDHSTIIEVDKPVDVFTGFLVDYSRDSGDSVLFKEKRILALESIKSRTEECAISRAVLKVM